MLQIGYIENIYICIYIYIYVILIVIWLMPFIEYAIIVDINMYRREYWQTKVSYLTIYYCLVFNGLYVSKVYKVMTTNSKE